MLAVAIIASVAAIVIYMIRHQLYYESAWWLTALLMLLVWAPLTAYIGVLLDQYQGYGNALVVALVVALMNLAGYYFARYLRKSRHDRAGRLRKGEVIASVAAILILPALVGIVVFNNGLDACELGGDWTFALAKDCQTCVIGLYIILFGVGSVVSMGINYFMLYCLYDPKGLDVLENPPEELYLKMMIGSMIATSVAWTLLMLFLPPVAGGGGGGGKKSGSSSRSSRGSYTSHAGSGTDLPDPYSLAELKERNRRRVQARWAKIGLHDPDLN